MLRVFLTIVLPLLLPTAVYVAWLRYAQWAQRGPHQGPQPGDAVSWAAVPWVWLAAAGALLLAIVLFVVTVHFGTSQPGVYVPPRWENGQIIPGHVEPGRSP
jgi:hypothetical protein